MLHRALCQPLEDFQREELNGVGRLNGPGVPIPMAHKLKAPTVTIVMVRLRRMLVLVRHNDFKGDSAERL